MFALRILRNILVFFPFFQQVISDHKPEYRIVGGENASISQTPWQGVFLANGSLCGCSLLSNSWAVTTARCTDKAVASEMIVGFGITNLLSVTSATVFGVIYFVNHPDYNKLTWTRNDISLLRINGFVNYTSNIQPIALPTAGVDVADGLNCIISGWGTTRANGSISYHLQRAFVPIVNNVQCREWYSAITYISFIHICAGYESGGIDSCQGDSGGPLACRTNTGTFVLEGITSFGAGCARPQLPGVYVRVSEYVTWIKNVTLISFAKPDTPYHSTSPASISSAPKTSASTLSTTSPFTSSKPTSFNSSASTVHPTVFTSNISSTSAPSLLTTIRQLMNTSSLLTSSTPSNLLSTNTSESLSNQFTTKSTAVSHFVASQLYCIVVSAVAISIANIDFN